MKAGKFTRRETPLPGLFVIEPTLFGDDRGFFMETFSLRDYEALGITLPFVQENHSKSRRGVLRGLHFQRTHPQGKLIRVVAGSVYDVAVDLRPESPTFGRWHAELLSASNRLQFYIPPRFAHGFLALEEETEFLYKCTDYYHPESDGGIRWDDPSVAVDWQLKQFGFVPEQLQLSGKDREQPLLQTIQERLLEDFDLG